MACLPPTPRTLREPTDTQGEEPYIRKHEHGRAAHQVDRIHVALTRAADTGQTRQLNQLFDKVLFHPQLERRTRTDDDLSEQLVHLNDPPSDDEDVNAQSEEPAMARLAAASARFRSSNYGSGHSR